MASSPATCAALSELPRSVMYQEPRWKPEISKDLWIPKALRVEALRIQSAQSEVSDDDEATRSAEQEKKPETTAAPATADVSAPCPHGEESVEAKDALREAIANQCRSIVQTSGGLPITGTRNTDMGDESHPEVHNPVTTVAAAVQAPQQGTTMGESTEKEKISSVQGGEDKHNKQDEQNKTNSCATIHTIEASVRGDESVKQGAGGSTTVRGSADIALIRPIAVVAAHPAGVVLPTKPIAQRLEKLIELDEIATKSVPLQSHSQTQPPSQYKSQAQCQKQDAAVILKERLELQRKYHEYQCNFPENFDAMPPTGSKTNKPSESRVISPGITSAQLAIEDKAQSRPSWRLESTDASNYATDERNKQPTPLFERLVTEEVQELKAYARIIENQNRRLTELERVHSELEVRLEVEAQGRRQLEGMLEARERQWAEKFEDLKKDRDNWKGVVDVEKNKNSRLIDQVVRKDQDIHRMLQRKVSRCVCLPICSLYCLFM
jgi:hypothetical protein